MTSKPPAPSDLADKFMLRMPDGMRDRIADAARSSGRSMNSEIVARLEGSFASLGSLSPGLKDWVEGCAASNHRSLDAEVAYLLNSVKEHRELLASIANGTVEEMTQDEFERQERIRFAESHLTNGEILDILATKLTGLPYQREFVGASESPASPRRESLGKSKPSGGAKPGKRSFRRA